MSARFTRPLVITGTLEGQIRHRRKLSKYLFFIDVLVTDTNEKEQGECDIYVHFAF